MADLRVGADLLEIPKTEIDNARVIAAWALSLRRVRDKLLGQDLFGEPAWEILLAIYAIDSHGRGLGLDELSGQVHCSHANLRRWLRIVVDRELVDEQGQGDARRYSLAPRALSMLETLSA